MNTKHVADKVERKTLKRTARKKAEEAKPLAPRADNVARGSMKRKVKKLVKGQTRKR
jgi:hypothetical protein